MVAKLDRRLVVEAGDGERLAERLKEILGWPAQRWHQLSTSGTAMSTELSWERYARQCVAIYGELIGRVTRHVVP
jgi:hypothetical protein